MVVVLKSYFVLLCVLAYLRSVIQIKQSLNQETEILLGINVLNNENFISLLQSQEIYINMTLFNQILYERFEEKKLKTLNVSVRFTL